MTGASNVQWSVHRFAPAQASCAQIRDLKGGNAFCNTFCSLDRTGCCDIKALHDEFLACPLISCQVGEAGPAALSSAKMYYAEWRGIIHQWLEPGTASSCSFQKSLGIDCLAAPLCDMRDARWQDSASRYSLHINVSKTVPCHGLVCIAWDIT